MSARVAVTGATGFLGQYVVVELASRGYEVVAISRGEQARVGANVPGVSTVRADILDRESIERALAGCKGVFHCAGRVSRDPADAAELQALHVTGTKNVLDAAEKVGIERAIVAGTSGTIAVAADSKAVLDETAPPALSIIASWPYYRTKLFAELAALEKHRPSAFDVIVVSPSLLFGPGDLHGSSTGDIVDLLEQRVPALPGGGMSFVDARDAALGMVLAWERGIGGQRYLLGAQNLTLAAFAQKIERLSGIKAPQVALPPSLKLARAGSWLDRAVAKRLGGQPKLDKVSLEMAQYFWYVDSTKARTELGWEPRDPMQTLAETVADLFARGVVWPAA